MTTSAEKSKVLVWDAPTRVFHWFMVFCFAGAYITHEGERWRLVHVTLGYTLGGLVAFRILWGVMGTRYARFASFVRGPSSVLSYLRSLTTGSPEHHIGHNPAGAMAIVLLILMSTVITITGWATYNEAGGEWVSSLHELTSNAMLMVVVVHVLAVIVSSRLHRENLARAMVTGTKLGNAADGISKPWRLLAAGMVVAVLVFWWQQWQSAPHNDQAATAVGQTNAQGNQAKAEGYAQGEDDDD